ncbi:hypothetical protein X926_01085 [Petrotoga sp. HWHPT.55.6.3]|nr:hypothetical protein X926_01085 [Petrotoga sp. HWHPT.55.6.3]
MGGRWVANKLLHELKSSDRMGVLLPTHFLKKIAVYAYIVSSNIIEDTQIQNVLSYSQSRRNRSTVEKSYHIMTIG